MQDTDLGRLMIRYASRRDSCPPPCPTSPTTPTDTEATVPHHDPDTTSGHRPPADWDNPDATPNPPDTDSPSEDQLHPPPTAARRMPILQRARLILYNRQQRKLRLAYIRATRLAAAKRSANFQPFSLTPARSGADIGEGHSAFTLGPITFCRRCGATKSLSQGLSIKRPCRRWAPHRLPQ